MHGSHLLWVNAKKNKGSESVKLFLVCIVNSINCLLKRVKSDFRGRRLAHLTPGSMGYPRGYLNMQIRLSLGRVPVID